MYKISKKNIDSYVKIKVNTLSFKHFGCHPPPENLEVGEIAVNNNSQNPFLAIKDTAGKIITFGRTLCINHQPSLSKFKTLWERKCNRWEILTGTFFIESYRIGCGMMSIYVDTQTNSLLYPTAFAFSLSSIAYKDRTGLRLYINQETHYARLVYCCDDYSGLYIKNSNILSDTLTQSIVLTDTNDWMESIPDDYGTAIFPTINRSDYVECSLMFSGIEYNGSKQISIDSIDCGEF